MMAKTKRLTNNGVSNVALRDTIAALRNEVIYPLQTLSDLLLAAHSLAYIADRVEPQSTLEGIGHLLDALCVKAKTILREHLDETNEGGD
jgi:hypothetical protein